MLRLFHDMFVTFASRPEQYHNNYIQEESSAATALEYWLFYQTVLHRGYNSSLCIVWYYTQNMQNVTIYLSHYYKVYKSNVNIPSPSYAFFLTHRYFLGDMQ